MIDQFPLWCRSCNATYEAFDDNGVCSCGTPNVTGLHNITVTIPVEAYSSSDAYAKIEAIVHDLIKASRLTEGAVVTVGAWTDGEDK